MQTSLDGFVCGPNNELDWIFPDFTDEYAQWGAGKLWLAGAHLMGSKTYGDMAAHWPTSKEPYAPPMNEIPKVVFSKTLKAAPWGETRIVSGDLVTEINRLKQEPGKHLLAHGGAGFAQSLVRGGVIDQYRLIVHPIVAGLEKSPFSVLTAPIRFKVLEKTTFKTTGIVALELERE